jgi:pimeloyl-ACP methyl ester carboxylesterase
MILHSFRYPREPAGIRPETKLLFLHGMGGNGSLWRPIGAELENDADLLCPDQRGHGQSLVPGISSVADYTPLKYGEDLRDTCAALDFSPAWVIGHSMGVRSACGYAKLSPDLILGLILVDLGFSGVAGGGVGEALSTFLNDLPPSFASRTEARAFLDGRCPDPSIALYLLAVSKTNLKTGELTFPFDQSALLKTVDASRTTEAGPWMEEFARTTGRPVYILRGTESRVYKAAEFAKDKERYEELPNVHFLEMAGAGHGLPFEKRKDFVRLVREWTGLQAT